MNIKVINDKYLADKINSRVDGKGSIKYYINIENKDDVINTVNFLSNVPSDVPTIVFDMYGYVHKKYIPILNARNLILVEPAINHRNGFMYLPYYIDMDIDTNNISSDKKYDIGFIDRYTDKFYIGLLNDISDDISIKMKNGKFLDGRSDSKIVYICDSKENSNSGRIPNIRDIFINGYVPVIHHSQYMLHSLFKDYIVFKSSDIKWLIGLYNNVGTVMLDDFKRNIKDYFPEMEINNYIDVLIRVFRQM